MDKKITTTAELDTLVRNNIITQEEADFIGQCFDHGYHIDFKLGKRIDDLMPVQIVMVRTGNVSITEYIKVQKKKVVDLKGNSLFTPSQTRQQRRAAYRKLYMKGK